MRAEESAKLPFLTKVMYGIGDVGFSLTSTLIGVFFLLFLTDVVGLRPALAGAAIMIAKQWDWINDPIIGHLSDRTHTRWGKRRPFLLFGFLPYGLAFSLLWWRPPFDGQTALAIYFALAYVVYDTAATFVYMPYYALTPELTPDYDERTALTAYRMAFSILGSLIAFTVPWAIIGTFRPENATRVWINGSVFAALSALPLLGTFWGTRERSRHISEERAGLRHSVAAAFHNQPFCLSAGLFLLTWLAVDVVQAVLVYFIKYQLRMEDQSDAVFAVISVTALIALPLWEWISRHTNKRHAYVIGVAFWAFVQLVLLLIQPDADTYVVFTLCTLAGIGVAAAHVLPWAIIPDAVEWDEAQTGKRHEGMFYSLIMLLQKAATGVALFSVGLLLDWSGYAANAAQQSGRAMMAIRILAGPVPALLLCGGIALALLYPISREHHLALRRSLAARAAPDVGHIVPK